MTDIALVLDGTGSDLALEGGDLVRDEGLVTAILLSLFSDALAAPDDDIPDGTTDRRGFWGTAAGDNYGSLLWLSDRGKAVDATAESVREAAGDALQWLIAQEIASEVRVLTSFGRDHEILLDVEIVRGESRTWSALWDAVSETDFELPGVSLRLLTY